MDRLLVIPAGGLGTRLGGQLPKLLVPVNGRPMVEHLLDLYAAVCDHAVVIVHPAAEGRVRQLLGPGVDLVIQRQPTGMLDAILLAAPVVSRDRPRRVLVTWCDQVAIHPATIARLAAATDGPDAAPLALLTSRRPDPYIHLQRDGSGRIERVLHRREGDVMPETGESDAGVFDLSLDAFLNQLPEYASVANEGMRTGERNFLPFIPWMSSRGAVAAVPCTAIEETVGVNTPDELALIERLLEERDRVNG